ncbi:MAG: hypothetical protein JST90_05225 [Bacteroidetes bacterium]|nr:hypothetical protein [Bacteroidota bacterium]
MSKRMYIVLVAILALGVMTYTAWQARMRNSEILTAFEQVNRSMQEQQDSLHSGAVITEKDMQATGDESRIKTWQALHNVSTQTSLYIDSLSHLIESHSTDDGDIEVADRIMIHDRNGLALYHRLAEYKSLADSLMKPYTATPPTVIDLTSAQTSEGKTGNNTADWINAYFHQVPSVAAITILHKFRNDVDATENMCSKQLLQK